MDLNDWIPTAVTTTVSALSIWLTNTLAQRRHRRERIEEDHLAADRRLWERIQEHLSPACMEHLRGLGDKWRSEELSGLRRFRDITLNEGTWWFHDVQLQKAHEVLVAANRALTEFIAVETFQLAGALHGLPGEWKRENPDRYRNVLEKLDHRANETLAAFDNLSRVAKQRLRL